MKKAIAVVGGGFAVVAVAGRIAAGHVDPWKARVAATECTPKTARIGDADIPSRRHAQRRDDSRRRRQGGRTAPPRDSSQGRRHPRRASRAPRKGRQ